VVDSATIRDMKFELEDTLRPEYDFKQLRVRKMGSERKSYAGTVVRLEPDMAKLLRSLSLKGQMRLMKPYSSWQK